MRYCRAQKLGDKTAARALAISCDVPVVPGTNEALKDVAAAKAFADEAGYPVMLKAAMGGGGRGMRVARACAPSLSNLSCRACLLSAQFQRATHATLVGCDRFWRPSHAFFSACTLRFA